MKPLADHLASYAAYHRDRRNIVTHAFGLPMIALGGLVLMSRPVLHFSGGIAATPAMLLAAATSLYYVVLDVRLGFILSVMNALLIWCASYLAGLSTSSWLSTGVGLIVAGTILQFVGHIFEGRRPAFIDDLVSTLIGPMFILVEASFRLGYRRDLQNEIERRQPKAG